MKDTKCPVCNRHLPPKPPDYVMTEWNSTCPFCLTKAEVAQIERAYGPPMKFPWLAAILWVVFLLSLCFFCDGRPTTS